MIPSSLSPNSLPRLATWPSWRLPALGTRAQAALLVLSSLLPTLLLYAQHLNDFSVVLRYWDGPNYLEVAKTLYNVPEDHPFVEAETTPAYFACHLPLYPLLIRLFAPLLGYGAAMLFVTISAAALATLVFWRLLVELRCVQNPWLSALAFTLLPARWIIYKSVGATEPLFLLCVFSSLLAYQRNRFGWALFFAGCCTLTRIVGVLMAVIFAIDLLRTRRWTRVPWLLLVGLPLLGTFSFYSYQYGDFWAYLSWNSHLLSARPMSLFGAFEGDYTPHSNELLFLLYGIYGLGVALLWGKPLLFTYAAVYYVFMLFVQHDDVSRYFLAMAHVALLVGYDRIFSSRQFKLLLPALLPLGMAYTSTLLPNNTADEDMYRKFLAQPQQDFFGPRQPTRSRKQPAAAPDATGAAPAAPAAGAAASEPR
jgi:hypothetical protein